MASEAGAIANVLWGVVVAGGLLANRKARTVLQALDAGSRVATGVGDLAKGQVRASTTQEQDSLLPLQRASTEMTNYITFNVPPALPNRDPEAALWLTPFIWNGERAQNGRSRLIPTADLVGPQTLFAPGYDDAGINVPGVYRVGYRLASEDNSVEAFGGGPILHIFDNDVWNYPRILAEYADPRPNEVLSSLYYTDPFNDSELALRFI